MRELTSEEILALCPEVIHKRDIPTKNPGGRPRTGGGSRKVPYWHEKDRIRAASVYGVTGKITKVVEITGIPAETLRRWKQEPWWNEVIDRIKVEKDEDFDQRLTNIIERSMDEIEDRLENGDSVYDNKTGKILKKPMGGKEIGVLTSIAFDKRDLIRRKQKTQVEQQSTKELLQSIANTVRDFVKITNQKTIEGEVTHVQEEDPIESAASAETR